MDYSIFYRYPDGPDEQLIEQIKNKIDFEQLIGSALKESGLNDITEYGREVYAEMEALISCCRSGINIRGATLYTTTYPCHNCTRHIIASGIKRVVYVEPYPKSRAGQLHNDSIEIDSHPSDNQKVQFNHFIGIGPRRYFDLFSTKFSRGYRIERKNDDGDALFSLREESIPRIFLPPITYFEREKKRVAEFEKIIIMISGGI